MTSPKSQSSAEYQQQHRARLTKRGGRLVQVGLEPEAAEALADLRRRGGFSSDREAIAAAIMDASYFVTVQVRLNEKEAEALATIRDAISGSDRDAIGAALLGEAKRLARRTRSKV